MSASISNSRATDAPKLRIFLADDHEVVRQGVRKLIENRPDWEICGEASNGRAAVASVEKLRPDLVIMDLGMPELGGMEATRQIRRSFPATEVLIFTGHEDEQLIHEVFAAGARSYLAKNDIGQHLIAAIESLAQHKPYFTSHTSEVIFSRYLDGRSGTSKDKSDSLTSREREIVQLLAEGKSNKEVASILGISVKTAETHRATVMRKLKMDSFADLVRYAIRTKIIQA